MVESKVNNRAATIILYLNRKGVTITAKSEGVQ